MTILNTTTWSKIIVLLKILNLDLYIASFILMTWLLSIVEIISSMDDWSLIQIKEQRMIHIIWTLSSTIAMEANHLLILMLPLMIKFK